MSLFDKENKKESEKDVIIQRLEERIKFLETKNKWLMNQVEHLEIQAWGSR